MNRRAEMVGRKRRDVVSSVRFRRLRQPAPHALGHQCRQPHRIPPAAPQPRQPSRRCPLASWTYPRDAPLRSGQASPAANASTLSKSGFSGRKRPGCPSRRSGGRRSVSARRPCPRSRVAARTRVRAATQLWQNRSTQRATAVDHFAAFSQNSAVLHRPGRLRPGASRTVETVTLVQPRQGTCGPHVPHLLESPLQ